MEAIPDYVDSLLRLSLLRRAEEDLPGALDKVEQAVELCQAKLDFHRFSAPLEESSQPQDSNSGDSGEAFWKEELRRVNSVKAETLCVVALLLLLFASPSLLFTPGD